MKEQEDTEPIDCSLEPSLTSNDSDPDSVESDTELEVLAARLEATAPFAAVDPTFRKSLRDKLLNILAEQPHHESVEAVLPSIPKTTRKRGDTEETNIDQEPILTSNNSASDPELAALVAYLDQTSSFAMTDPAFRKMIQDELARIHARYSSSDQGVERALEKTEASLLVATSY